MNTSLGIKDKKGDSFATLQCDIAIVGGGFSGATLAANLLRYCDPAFNITMLNKGHLPGRGIAYSTEYNAHLLNVRASEMSAWPQDNDHFVEWLREEWDPSISPEQYLPRSLFGKYMECLLVRSANERPDVSFSCLADEVLCANLESGGVRLRMNSRQQLFARRVVLATGGAPSQELSAMRHASPDCYVANVWSSDALGNLSKLQSILLLGTGLTAVDQIFALRANNFQGNIFMLSRHGLLPAPQTSFSRKYSAAWTSHLPLTTRAILSAVREQIEYAELSGHSGHDVLDSLRPATQQIWQSLCVSEKRRFLRHVRRYWDMHRHRIAPAPHAALTDLIEDGTVVPLAGRLTRYEERKGRAEIAFQERHTAKVRTLSIDRVMNCTGPGMGTDLFKTRFFKSLLDSGIARPDSVKIGLDVTETGALIDASGQPSTMFFALGALRKGCFWETTAVPEIRTHASHLAHHLLNLHRMRTVNAACI